MKFIAVTACPTGIAHTYIAAESLRKTAEENGFEIKVETRGAVGVENELTMEDILAADVVIVAVAVTINTSQFDGKPIIEVPITDAIRDPLGVFQKAIEAVSNFSKRENDNNEAFQQQEDNQTVGFQLPKPFMSGISHLIPFIAVTGIFMTLFSKWPFPLFKEIGVLSNGLMIPIIAGAIAYSMADRPGIAPGMLSGMIAGNVSHSGVVGGIVGGLISGWVTILLKKVKLPKELNGLLPVFLIPAVSSLIVGFLTILILGNILSFMDWEITNGIDHLPFAASIGLGAVIGAMLAYDLGGPINKIAYAFCLFAMVEGIFKPQAAALSSGMVPSLAVALATTIYPKIFTIKEQRAGKKAWLLGLSFVAEGAQPFLTINQTRMKTVFVTGGAVSGALSMAFQISAVVPHGGILAVFFVNHPIWFLISTAVGTFISTAGVLIVKRKFSNIPRQLSGPNDITL